MDSVVVLVKLKKKNSDQILFFQKQINNTNNSNQFGLFSSLARQPYVPSQYLQESFIYNIENKNLQLFSTKKLIFDLFNFLFIKNNNLFLTKQDASFDVS
jgi:hypothetical protein